MTMPDERARSLRWAHELLAELVAYSSIPEGFRARAQTICQAFPTPQQVRMLVDSKAERLPLDNAEAIEAARALFLDIQLGSVGSPETRKNLTYTMRHYPLPGSAKTRFAGGVDNWLSPSP